MIYIEALLMTTALAVSIYSSYKDFKEGIIPNYVILAGFFIGLLCHITLLVLGYGPFYPSWLINMLIADAFAFVIFWGKLWAAGDAKLFMVLFFLSPPRIFDADQLSNSIMPYIFIFIPALVWILGDSIIRFVKKEPRKKQYFNVKKWLISFFLTMIEITGFHSLLRVLFPAFAETNELLIFVLIMAYAYFCGSTESMRKWYVVLIHALFSVVIWIICGWEIAAPDIRSYLILLIVMAIQVIASMYNYQLIQTAKTAKGMILSAETIIMFQKSKVHSLPADPSEQLTAKLTEEEAAAVRRWETTAKGEPMIWIVRKVPFAFMIGLGFMAWLIFKFVR